MGLFGALAAAATDWRILPPGSAGGPEQPTRLPVPDPNLPTGTGPSPGTAGPTLPGPTAPASPSAPLTGLLRGQLNQIATRQGAATVRDACLPQVAALFEPAPGAAGLEDGFARFAQSWRALADDPSDTAARQAVVDSGVALAGTVRDIAGGVEDLANQLAGAVVGGLQDLDRALTDIHQANRQIAGQSALGRPTAALESQRDSRIATVVDLTGAAVFPRENGAVALFTADGRPLLDQRPARFVGADGNVTLPAGITLTEGRLGALIRMTADGSRRNPPQRPDPDPGSEVIRKLRSQLDAVAGTMLGRSRAGQPTSFADSYDGAPAAPGDLIHGFFLGSNRLTLEVNPALVSGQEQPKAGAAEAVATALHSTSRQFIADGLAVSRTSYGGLAGTISGLWQRLSSGASQDARVTEAAGGLITGRGAQGQSLDLETEVTRLQTLQTALGSTRQVGHALAQLLPALASAA